MPRLVPYGPWDDLDSVDIEDWDWLEALPDEYREEVLQHYAGSSANLGGAASHALPAGALLPTHHAGGGGAHGALPAQHSAPAQHAQHAQHGGGANGHGGGGAWGGFVRVGSPAPQGHSLLPGRAFHSTSVPSHLHSALAAGGGSGGAALGAAGLSSSSQPSLALSHGAHSHTGAAAGGGSVLIPGPPHNSHDHAGLPAPVQKRLAELQAGLAAAAAGGGGGGHAHGGGLEGVGRIGSGPLVLGGSSKGRAPSWLLDLRQRSAASRLSQGAGAGRRWGSPTRPAGGAPGGGGAAGLHTLFEGAHGERAAPSHCHSCCCSSSSSSCDQRVWEGWS